MSSSSQPNPLSSAPPAPPATPENAGSRQSKFPLANWPSIKIVQPRQGRYSPNVDERCFTYCSQTVAGRSGKREPWCRSICIRKIFQHEVQNVMSQREQATTHADRVVKYPLPPEGQHFPELMWGGSSGDAKRVNYWEEGWYLWVTKSRWASQEKMDLMSFDLEKQAKWISEKEARKKAWTDWKEHEQQRMRDAERQKPIQDQNSPIMPDDSPSQYWGPLQPVRPPPDTTHMSLLLHLPPPLPPIYQQLENLLAPTRKVMVLLHESVKSGDQVRLAEKLWEKAWTPEPFALASNACSQMWQRWKDGPPDDTDSEKGF